MEMPYSSKINVIECCHVSPPPKSVFPTTLPLTFLDIPWLFFHPNQPLLFYEFPHSTSHFVETLLPNLKLSLSLTLQHFYAFCSKLVIPRQPNKPRFEFSDDDSVSLIVAESTGDFNYLVQDYPRRSEDFRHLVPNLPAKVGEKSHLFAVQITVFPETGICIGFSLHNVVADGRTFDNFLKSWASISKDKSLASDLSTSNDRSTIIEHDTDGLESTMLKQLWQRENAENCKNEIRPKGVRSTFVVNQPQMEMIKKWIITRSEQVFGSTKWHLSPYVLTCAFVWVCWIKTHWSTSEGGGEKYRFGFIAGGLTSLGSSIPENYVGNCVAFGLTEATRKELMGENGILYAAKAIGDTIMELDGNALGGARKWIPDWEVTRASELHVIVSGSPKLDLYGLDFGWGRPRKIEEVSVDERRAISLCGSRYGIGGIEVGLSLPKPKMDVFISLLNEGLNNLTM